MKHIKSPPVAVENGVRCTVVNAPHMVGSGNFAFAEGDDGRHIYIPKQLTRELRLCAQDVDAKAQLRLTVATYDDENGVRHSAMEGAREFTHINGEELDPVERELFVRLDRLEKLVLRLMKGEADAPSQ